MFFRLFLAVAVTGLLYWYWVSGMPAARRKSTLRNSALLLLGGVLVLLAVTGRAHWFFGLLGGLLPFIRSLVLQLVRMKLFQWLSSGSLASLAGAAGAAANTGRRSEVATETLRMFLDHDSGQMAGEVLTGSLAGRQLDELAFEQLLGLLGECRSGDPQAAALLEAYLERTHPQEWSAVDAEARQGGAGEEAPPVGGALSRAEARQILGVTEQDDADAIRAAHRRLIQRLHPDRGGSSFLAAQINRAKDLLLDE